MIETGRVLEIKENTVTIAPDRSAACFGCMNMECKKGGGFITAENPLALLLETGQMVEVQSPPAITFLTQALMAFLPPIMGFIAGFLLSRFLFPEAGEGVHVFLGIVLLFTAAFIVYMIGRKKPAGKAYTVTRIVESER